MYIHEGPGDDFKETNDLLIHSTILLSHLLDKVDQQTESTTDKLHGVLE